METEIVPYELSLTLEAGQKQAFAHSTVNIAEVFYENNVEYGFWGRAVKSIETDGVVTMSMNFDHFDAMYQSDSFIASYLKALDDERKRLFVENNYVPLKVKKSEVLNNGYYPEVKVYFMNLSEKNIAYFEVAFNCYDANGKTLVNPYTGRNRFYGNTDYMDLTSGGTMYIHWDLSDFSLAKSVGNFKIVRVIYTDGTSWTNE
ncbi:hypothetical protein [Paenibacillus thailandensis]|uniref:Uncharacterized protein n=1 Tax=Paenibacillus thailandensis TaxID=393250 RepID=A0ABW5R513_9BACL